MAGMALLTKAKRADIDAVLVAHGLNPADYPKKVDAAVAAKAALEAAEVVVHDEDDVALDPAALSARVQELEDAIRDALRLMQAPGQFTTREARNNLRAIVGID